MLAVPAKMVTDHFDRARRRRSSSSRIRGSSAPSSRSSASVKFKLATEDAVPVALAMSVACGALYPWNAKFGYLSPGLPTKYRCAAREVRWPCSRVLGIAAMMGDHPFPTTAR